MFNYKRIKRLEEELGVQKQENKTREETIVELRQNIRRFFEVIGRGDAFLSVYSGQYIFSFFKSHVETLERQAAAARDREKIVAICRAVIRDNTLTAPYNLGVPQCTCGPHTAFDADVRFNSAVAEVVKERDTVSPKDL
jgi:hypothetical protein